MTIASEITRLQGAKADLKTSIEAKGVTVPSSATIDTYSGYVDQIQTSSTIVNGVIESYLASTSTVAADTFVEFVSSLNDSAQTSSNSKTPNAVALNDSKVFVALSNGATATSTYLYGVVCTISDGVISVGTETQLSTQNYENGHEVVVKLSEDSVLVAHGCGSSSYPPLYAVACTISGSTITAGTDTQVSSASGSGALTAAVALDSGTAVVFHPADSNYRLNGIICSVSGTSITLGTDTRLVDYNQAAVFMDAVALDGERIFLAHRYGTSTPNYARATICSVSGGTITAANDKNLSSRTSSTQGIAVAKLSSDKVAVVRNGFAMVCTISGTNWTGGAESNLTGINASSDEPVAVTALSESRFLALAGHSNVLYACVCSVKGTTVIPGSLSTVLSASLSTRLSSTSFVNPFVFITYGSSPASLATVKVAIQEAANNIDGFTKTECTTITAGEVWVLNA